MSVALTLDIKTWQPGEPERVYTAHELRERYDQLRKDMQFLPKIMFDNLGCNLVIDGAVVSRCTFMYDGEHSPDLMYLFEDHVINVFKGEPTTVEFFEERTSWRFTPEAGNAAMMKWEVLDLSQGKANIAVTNNGTCERLQFVNSALAWLTEAKSMMERYKDDVRKAEGEDLTRAIDLCRRLLEYTRDALSQLGWKEK